MVALAIIAGAYVCTSVLVIGSYLAEVCSGCGPADEAGPIVAVRL